MRDLARIERILGKLRERWLASPDLRLGQLVVVLARAADPFYFEDDALEAALDAGLSDDAAIEARRLSPAWEAEVERRVKAYEAGEAELTPWPVARAALRERIRKRLEDEARMRGDVHRTTEGERRAMTDWLDPNEQAGLLERLRSACGERKRGIASLSREEYTDAIEAIEALARRVAELEVRRMWQLEAEAARWLEASRKNPQEAIDAGTWERVEPGSMPDVEGAENELIAGIAPLFRKVAAAARDEAIKVERAACKEICREIAEKSVGKDAIGTALECAAAINERGAMTAPTGDGREYDDDIERCIEGARKRLEARRGKGREGEGEDGER